jgi:hypothetical protein
MIDATESTPRRSIVEGRRRSCQRLRNRGSGCIVEEHADDRAGVEDYSP